MEKVYVWIGGVGAWSDPANWRYGEYNGPGFYDPMPFSGHALANEGAAARAPGADDTVSFGMMGGQVFGGGKAGRLVGWSDALPISLADRTADGRSDVYSFGSLTLGDRMLTVNGAVLASKATDLDIFSRIVLTDAGAATDQWGRTYSADLGALTMRTEFRPSGTWSGAVVAGKNIVEADSITGNRTVRTDAYDPTGQTGPIGGLYSDTGLDYRLDPAALPGFYLESKGAPVALVRQGDHWSYDLHVSLGDPQVSFLLGAANVGTGGSLSGAFSAVAVSDGSWKVSATNSLPAWIGAGGHSATYALSAATGAVGVHTFSAVLHSSDDSFSVGHAVFAEQSVAVRVIVDAPSIVGLKAMNSGARASEDGGKLGSMTFEATLDAAAASAQTVQWRVALPGGATADDFVGGAPPSGTLAFAPGEVSKAFSVFFAADAAVEPDETFAVQLSGASTGLRLGAAQVAGTILNDDAPTVSISVDRPGQFEGKPGEGVAYTFTAKLSAASSGQQSVDWVVSGGSLNPADDADFVGGEAPSGALVFAAGETEKSFVVRVAGDAAAESDETFIVALSAATSGIDVRPQTYALATVLTDDWVGPPPPPPPPVHVSDAQIAAYTAMAERMLQDMLATHGDGFWLR